MLELLGVLWDAFTDNFTSIDYDYPDTSLSEAYANYLDTRESLYSDPPSQPSPRTTPVQQSDTPAHSQTREEFTHMAHVTYNYKGRSYSFAFEYTHSAANGYRAYIVSAPSYGRHSGDLHSTHRLRDGSRYYICWSEKITTVAQMDAVAELWSKATVMYIANGGSSLDQYAEKILRAESSG